MPILSIPDVRQTADHDCGDAACSAVLRFHGLTGRRVATLVDGTDPRTLEAVFWRSGLAVQSGRMDVLDLRHHTRRGRPVVCLVTSDAGGGHWVVVAGVARGSVHYHDPTHGTKRERSAKFAERWRDTDRLGHVFAGWGVAVG